MKDLKQELLVFLDNYRNEIKTNAYELMNQQMPVLTEELFSLFEKTGNRLNYENVYFTRRKFLAILGIEAILEKEKSGKVQADILEKLVYVIEEICKEECWALPAHVARKNRKTDNSWRIVVDLFAAETAQTLSELWDRLSEELPLKIREIMVDEIERRVLHPFFSSTVPYDDWEHSDHNWNAVCSGCIGSICIHLMERGDEFEKRINRVCESLRHYINGFSEDGVCKEGLVYYVYGMNYFLNFAQELFDYSCGEKNLFVEDITSSVKWKNKLIQIAQFPAKCYFPDGLPVSFSDCTKQNIYRMGILSTLAMHLGSLEFPTLDLFGGLHSDSCYRFAAIKMDILNTVKYLTFLENCKKTEVSVDINNRLDQSYHYSFEDAQWYIAGSTNNVGFACKGGHNGEQHNHNDVGHFIYEKDGVMFLTDLGAGEYTREYFDGERYNILCNSSFGHSVPIVNGMGESAGKQYLCRVFDASEDGHIKMEIGGAYDFGANDKVPLSSKIIRNLQFDFQNGQLFLTDVFEDFSPNTEIEENLITQIRPTIFHNKIFLEQKNRKGILIKVQITILDRNPEEHIHIHEYEHINHQGISEPVYAIRWKVRLAEKNGMTRVQIEYKS